MADTKISALPASTTPLAGTEVLPIVQSSATKQVSVANLTAGRTVYMTALGIDTAAVQAGYDLTIGASASAANIYLASSGSGSYITGVSSASSGNGYQIGHLTNVNTFQVQVGGTGGVQVASGGTSWSAISDERLKDVIEPISDAVDKVGQLRAIIGKYKTDAEGTRRSFLIAQDVQSVLPEAVSETTLSKEDEQVYLTVAYSEVIPLLVAAINELSAEVKALKTAQ